MSETTETNPTRAPEQPKKSKSKKNEPTIPHEYDDQIWELHQEGLTSVKIAAALVLVGLVCTRHAVRRRVKRLARERLTEENGFSWRQEAIEKGREAIVRRRELEEELDEIDDGMRRARLKGDMKRVQMLAAAGRQIRASLNRYDRQIQEAKRALAEAKAEAKDTGKAGFDPDVADQIKRSHQDLRQTIKDLKRDPDETEDSDPTSAPSSAAETAASATAEDKVTPVTDPNAPVPSIIVPADGAKLTESPVVYAGETVPNGELVVSIDGIHNKYVTADQDGDWAVEGSEVPPLEPGDHFMKAIGVVGNGKFSLVRTIQFTVLGLFLFLLMPSRAQASSLAVNIVIPARRGLARPPFAILRVPQAPFSASNQPADRPRSAHAERRPPSRLTQGPAERNRRGR